MTIFHGLFYLAVIAVILGALATLIACIQPPLLAGAIVASSVFAAVIGFYLISGS